MYYTYFAFRRKYSSQETGTYYSYEIAVYGPLYRRPVQVIRDVSTNDDLIFWMITLFNAKSLSPVHFLDAVQDFLSLE